VSCCSAADEPQSFLSCFASYFDSGSWFSAPGSHHASIWKRASHFSLSRQFGFYIVSSVFPPFRCGIYLSPLTSGIRFVCSSYYLTSNRTLLGFLAPSRYNTLLHWERYTFVCYALDPNVQLLFQVPHPPIYVSYISI
jgi:hypothetical protein